jgi:hypothetical protein
MKYVRSICPILLLVAFFAGCSALNTKTTSTTIHNAMPYPTESAIKQRKLLIGKWLGQAATDDGREIKWLSELKSDGTFALTFRTYNSKGDYQEQTEIGFWGVSGQIHFTIIRDVIVDKKLIPADPTDPYYYDAYEILKLNDQEFEHKAVTTGDIYKSQKVSDNYQLPEEL